VRDPQDLKRRLHERIDRTVAPGGYISPVAALDQHAVDLRRAVPHQPECPTLQALPEGGPPLDHALDHPLEVAARHRPLQFQLDAELHQDPGALLICDEEGVYL
jgi:hypothetical protein